MEWGVNEWVAVGSAVLALASLLVSWRIAGRQTKLQYETLRAEMDAEVIGWAGEAIDAVSHAATVAKQQTTLTQEQLDEAVDAVAWKLSSRTEDACSSPMRIRQSLVKTRNERSEASARRYWTPWCSLAVRWNN